MSEGDDDRFVSVARNRHEATPEPTAPVAYEESTHGKRLFDSGREGILREPTPRPSSAERAAPEPAVRARSTTAVERRALRTTA